MKHFQDKLDGRGTHSAMSSTTTSSSSSRAKTKGRTSNRHQLTAEADQQQAANKTSDVDGQNLSLAMNAGAIVELPNEAVIQKYPLAPTIDPVEMPQSAPTDDVEVTDNQIQNQTEIVESKEVVVKDDDRGGLFFPFNWFFFSLPLIGIAVALWNRDDGEYLPKVPTLNAVDSDQDNRIDASGTADPNTTIVVTWPDGSSTTAAVGTAGTYSVESPLTQTSGRVSAVSVDAQGRNGQTTTFDYSDQTQPGLTSLKLVAASDSSTIGDALTNQQSPSIQGVSEPKATIKVVTPVGETVTAVADVSGNWSVTLNQPLENGSKQSLTVTAVDQAGNSTVSALVLNIDAILPNAPVINALNSTSDLTPTISGTGEANTTVTVKTPVGEMLTAVVAANGSWSVVPSKNFTEGVASQNVTAVLVDAAGNTSLTVTGAVTIDTKSPVVGIDSMVVTNDTTPVITGTGEAGNTIQVTTPVGEKILTTVDDKGKWSITPTKAFNEGLAQSIQAVAIDAANNSSAATASVSIDVSAPQIQINAISVTNNTTPSDLRNGRSQCDGFGHHPNRRNFNNRCNQ